MSDCLICHRPLPDDEKAFHDGCMAALSIIDPPPEMSPRELREKQRRLKRMLTEAERELRRQDEA